MAMYKRTFTGYALVEADSLEEAVEAFENDDADFTALDWDPAALITDEEADDLFTIPNF